MKKRMTSIVLGMLLGNAVFAQGAGNALHYNTTNGYVSAALPSLFNNLATNDFTVETWLSADVASTSKRVFFAQFNTSNYVSILINSSNVPYVFVMAGGLNYSANTSTSLNSGEWYHFAVTWDASAKVITCYINGIEVSHISGGGSSTGTDNTMTIGSRTDGGQIFNGALDNMRIWSDIRTSCEIYGSMNTEFTVAQPNLIADYNFNAGVAGANNAGVTTLDELNNNFDGTLNGFVLNGTASNWVGSGATTYTQNKNDGTAYLTDTQVACDTFTWMNGTLYSNSVSGVTYNYNSTAGCPVISTLNLTINPLPNVSAGLDFALCEEESVTLSGSGAISYTWNNGVTDNLAFVPASTMNYIVNGTDANGCINADTVTVTVNPLPAVNAGSDLITCAGTTVTFSGSGTVSYTWNNGITDNTPFTANSSGTYIVEGTDANGCVNVDTVMLTVNSLPFVDAGTDQTICAETEVTLAASGDPATYTWNNGVTDNVSFAPTATADYIVTASDVNGCTNTDTITVTVNPLPIVTVTQTDLTLSVPAASSYQWINCDSGLAISGETNQEFTVNVNGNYAVVVTNSDGCVDTSACTLINYMELINQTNRDFEIYPNPAKDFFTISQLNPAAAASLSLYDASGKLVLTEAVTTTTLTIPTSNLDRGIYFIKIQSTETEYAPVKLILN